MKDETLPDGSIIQRVLAGETQLFEVLMRRHAARVFRAAMSILRNPADAEEVVQESFVRAYVHLAGLHDLDCFPGWISRIAAHQALRRAKRAAQRVPMDPCLLVAADNPERNALVRERVKHLHEAVFRLPRQYREVVILRDLQEVDTTVAAKSLRLSVANVKVRLHRAHLMLRRELHKRRLAA